MAKSRPDRPILHWVFLLEKQEEWKGDPIPDPDDDDDPDRDVMGDKESHILGQRQNDHDSHDYPQNCDHQVPRNFKAMTSRAQKLFRKVLDPEPEKRLQVLQFL